MNEDSNWLYHDHLDLEDLLNDCRAAAKRREWAVVARLFGQLLSRLKGHMRVEEEVLFPAYEQLPGAPRQPTESLRNDHDAMVRWCRDLHFSVEAQDAAGFVGALELLKTLLARHDEKEEQLFLPMAGHALFGQREEVLRRLGSLDWKEKAGTARNWDF
jgi:iron-sulfur cluster repair protein YtfE (RIC family)